MLRAVYAASSAAPVGKSAVYAGHTCFCLGMQQLHRSCRGAWASLDTYTIANTW